MIAIFFFWRASWGCLFRENIFGIGEYLRVLILQDLPVRHLLDVMHCEKIVCDNILKTIMGEKDNAAS